MQADAERDSAADIEHAQAQPPHGRALAWASNAVGAKARVITFRPLIGGVASAVHHLVIEDGDGVRHDLVLRRFIRADWMAAEPHIPAQEARALEVAGRTGLPVPELVSLDATGAQSDVPSILMTWLPGEVRLAPADEDAWLAELAAPLAAIHSVAASECAGLPLYAPHCDLRALEPPSWTRATAAWERILELVCGAPQPEPVVFVHRDYHPTNILWNGGTVSGVVDWTKGCRGPAPIDRGHCRLNLVQLHGVDAALRFGAHITQGTGEPEPHPYWDAITLVEALPEPEVYAPWRMLGVRNLDAATIRARLDDYAETIAARA